MNDVLLLISLTSLDFLKRFCKLKLAEKSLEYDEYARALMYLEDYIYENKMKLQDHLPTLSVSNFY